MNNKTKKELNLESLTEAEDASSLEFIGTALICETYHIEWETSTHYLLKNDPWISKQEFESATLTNAIPKNATYYIVGKETSEARPYKEKMKITIPITFFKERI